MRIASHAVVASLILIVCGLSLAGQQKSPKDAPPAGQHTADAENTPEGLLERSYVSGRNFPLEERCFQLVSLAYAAGRIPSSRAKALTKSWSRELLRHASELPPSWDRAAFKKNAVEALAQVDPVAALKLLRTVDAPESGAHDSEDLRASAAEGIFSQLWHEKGASALEAIQSEARQIGRTGEYPYSAMSLISTKLAERKDTADVQSTFREALEFYGKGPRVRSADQQFVSYLEVNWPYLPSSLQEESLKVVVAHLTREEKPDPNVTEVGRVATSKGTASFRNGQMTLLYSILPKVRELDPEWAKRLEDEYPELKQPGSDGTLQYKTTVRVFNTTNAYPEQVAAIADHMLQATALSHLKQQAASDPQEAAKLLQSLNDPELQSEALGSLAVAYAGRDPKHAADLLTTAQKGTDNLSSGLPKLRALASLAESAVELGDLPRADDAMQKAFDLGEELVSEDLDLHPGERIDGSEAYDELSRVTRLGTQVEFRATMTRLDHLRNETLRAFLLIAVAEGVQERKTKESKNRRSE